jgi:hypothetical protein
MGAWDVGLFADDTALDVREAWVEPVRRGRSPADVTAEILGAFGAAAPRGWLALGATQWRWGRLEPLVRERAVALLDSGQALGEWAGTEYEAARRRVLGTLRKRLAKLPPPPKWIKPRPRFDTDWKVGEFVGYRLSDGRWTLFQVISHDPDYGGIAPVCVLLDYVGDALCDPESATTFGPRPALRNPLAWTAETIGPLIAEGVLAPEVTPTSLDASTRWPHPVFTLGAFRKGERPARRLISLGVGTARYEIASHRLSLGIRWRDFDGLLASTFDLPPQPRLALGSLLPFLD